MNSALSRASNVLLACAILGLTLAFNACVSPEPQALPREAKGLDSNRPSTDLLRPGDLLVITFSGVSSPLPAHQDRVRDDGKITLPDIGDIQAAGKMRAQLQQDIHDAYVPKLYKQLTVNVNPDVRYFFVGGEVKREGNYPYMGNQLTVLKAINAAGGFDVFAQKKKVQLTRSDGTKPIIIDCVKAQKNTKLDLLIYPDDRIFVPRRNF